jgi:hypothetical protein
MNGRAIPKLLSGRKFYRAQFGIAAEAFDAGLQKSFTTV